MPKNSHCGRTRNCFRCFTYTVFIHISLLATNTVHCYIQPQNWEIINKRYTSERFYYLIYSSKIPNHLNFGTANFSEIIEWLIYGDRLYNEDLSVHSRRPVSYYLRPVDRTGVTLRIKRSLGSKAVAEEHKFMY